MHLVADRRIDVALANDLVLRLDPGDRLLTEVSATFTVDAARTELAAAGMVAAGLWSDGRYLPGLWRRADRALAATTVVLAADPARFPAGSGAGPAPASTGRRSLDYTGVGKGDPMITRFGTLYVGQVDHEHLGFDTPAVNDRWYDDDHLASPLHVAEDLAVQMDDLGYDTLWLAEHHFQREGYECIPNIPLLATHLAARTERLRFGCGFNIIPVWHPLRLAEDYAMADILTRGRVRLGVGRGYHSRELASLGPAGTGDPAGAADDPDAARDRFEEQVEVLLTALRQPSFRHRGRHYRLPPDGIEYRGYELEDLTLVPKPRHSTECWQPIVSASDRGLDFMLDHDIKGFVGGGAASGGASETVARRWQAKLAERGRDTELGTDLVFGFSFYLADSEAEAKAAGRPILEEYQKMFGPLGFAGRLTDDQLDRLADPARAATAGLPTIDDAIAAGSWLVGPPEVLIEALSAVQETYPGLEEVMVAQPVGARPETIGEQLERFAAEVMPAFARRQAPAEPSPDEQAAAPAAGA